MSQLSVSGHARAYHSYALKDTHELPPEDLEDVRKSLARYVISQPVGIDTPQECQDGSLHGHQWCFLALYVLFIPKLLRTSSASWVFAFSSNPNAADYLNASTNFMDKTVAQKIVNLFAFCLNHYVRPDVYDGKENVVLVGPELAGGVSIAFFSFCWCWR